MEILHIDAVDTFYGDLQILRSVSLSVPESSITAIVGSNGAGKTTLLNSIVGLLRLRSGSISFRGERIDTLRPYEIAAKGIAMVPEGRRLFSDMTVLENLQLGAYQSRARGRVGESMTRVFELFPRLRDRLRQRAGTLSGGEQQMVAIGRALMAMPALLILDEPSLGLMPLLTTAIFDVIKDIREQGVGVLIVEQNVGETLEVADTYYIMEVGRITHTGLCKDFEQQEELRRAYLGW